MEIVPRCADTDQIVMLSAAKHLTALHRREILRYAQDDMLGLVRVSIVES
jgi:hypothetical protein